MAMRGTDARTRDNDVETWRRGPHNKWKEYFIVVYISGSNEITSEICRETGSVV